MDLRANIAAEHGFALYRRYTLSQVAGFLGKDESTVKRNKANMPHVREASGAIFWLGIHIADWLAFGEDAVKLHPKVETWADTKHADLPLETGSSASAETLPLGTGENTTLKAAQPNAILSALQTKK